jgi:uncharacterized protein YbjT (DUF2867 family)
MKKVLLAGASGSLGRYIAKELKQRGYWVRAIARDLSKLQDLHLDDEIKADLTDATSLQGCCQGIDLVFSCAGASMKMGNFKDRTSFYQVDYQGNLNLLNEAKKAPVEKFAYVSLAGADKLHHVEYADAHEKFVEALASSGLNYGIVRPTGFFSFSLELLNFAKRGFGIVIGDGTHKTNPIHDQDLARACADVLEGNQKEMMVGGPDVLTRKEQSALAFEVLGKKPNLRTVSPRFFKLLIAPLKLSNKRIYALMDFGIAVTQLDVVAPSYGTRHLKDFFESEAKRWKD